MASQGPSLPGTAISDNESGNGADDWVTPTNIQADDGTEAQITAASYDAGDFSFILKAKNFGFSAPAGATIDGVEVEIDRRCFAGTAVDLAVQLLDASGMLASTNRASASAWPASLAVASYGSASDKWDMGVTLTPALVNDVDFGVGLQVQATAANTDIGVDFIRMTVHYTPGTSADVTGTAAAGIDESDIVAGGKTIVITLTGETWIP